MLTMVAPRLVAAMGGRALQKYDLLVKCDYNKLQRTLDISLARSPRYGLQNINIPLFSTRS